MRTLVFGVGAAAVAAVMLLGISGLPAFGSFAGAYGSLLLRTATMERSLLNVATAVNFDYRGFDTMGEEFILFTAVAGVLLIFSELRSSAEIFPEPMERPHDRGQTGAIRWFPTALVGFVSAMGMNIALHTTVTPGGGFQGGAIAASAFLCAYLGVGYFAFDRLANRRLYDALEALGAGAYAAIGIATAFAGGAFLKNILPLGKEGAIVNGGTIFLINACVFVEVTAGFVLLLLAYVHQTHSPMEKPD